MRPTLRGLTTLAIVALALAASWHAGPRSLNAVVAPLVVVCVAAVVVVGLRSRPAVDRAPVEPGFPGDRRTVSFTLESDAAVGATIRDRVGDGLAVVDDSEPVFETTLESGRQLSYDVDLAERGEHTLGPLSVAVTDVFGLVTRRFDLEEVTPVLVYPRVAALDSGVRRDLRGSLERAAEGGHSHDEGRDEFDHVRDYRRGDPLGDVHWKASAKRPDGDLLVTERASGGSVGSITVVLEGVSEDAVREGASEVTAREGAAETVDDLATTAAAVVDECLEAGARVGLVAGEHRREPGSGPDHYHDLLSVLARWDGAGLEAGARGAADVVVRASESGPIVAVDGAELQVGSLDGTSDRADAGDETGSGADGTARVDGASSTGSEVSP